MMLKTTFIIGFAGLLVAACSSSSTDSGSTEMAAADAKSQALVAVPGTASEPVKLDEGDEHRWVVSVKVSNGATVDVEFTRATKVLEEIKDEKGPFTYDLPAPKSGLMTFTQAKAKALASKAGTVEVWEVKPPSNLYEFYVRDADTKLWEIKMTADKGDISSVVQKDKPD